MKEKDKKSKNRKEQRGDASYSERMRAKERELYES